ncbi:hypothetical protein GALMADRAFT_61075 [Galerina marginata CBS 339.88]|uniref:CxC2-like cysteine cluster KDZ transposase-associated domain-containing protein n=1 Tax=Galerina marginata (strain CBS 339.88) TaxID=685588 RepID=A0A067TD93_GALM3|nr:hypothetical protein GALMADRAFT_61075 [Galerina marginata CBS 339.88]
MDPSSSRPAKRQRTGLLTHHSSLQTAWHDVVPLPGAVDVVHATEGSVRRNGSSRHTALTHPAARSTVEPWKVLATWTPQDSAEFALDPTEDLYNAALEADVMMESPLETADPKVEKKKAKSQVSVSTQFLFISAVYLLVALAVSVLSFQDIFDFYLMYSIQRWTGSHFIKTTLKTLGLKVQLNHGSLFCPNPVPCHASLLVLHTNGIHEVDIRYCGCDRAIPQHLQLLRRRLYPASQITVKTCASFELLEHLHMLALTTKASTYDFYRALEKSTNNTGMNVPKSRYRALSRMNLQWRHLQMLKWGGRANDASGVEGTKDGELAVRCPSCPHPGINLSDGWEAAPDGAKFLYMMFICMDANFRLKNQLVSNYSQDPGLGTGWAYMIPRKAYEAYVLSRANDEDISTCVGLQALAQANTRFSRGLRYTGVGLAACGRTEMIFPCGVGNLQKGERYANMDYLFAMVLQFIFITLVLISYDIACQWFINLFRRAADWPEELRLRPAMTFIPAIPKLHEPMHEAKDHQVYSLNFIKGCGHSDCECPERIWSPHNALGNSTKTMGPGSRQDVLDDHFGFWNWLKYIGLGTALLRRYQAAVAQRNLQKEGHRGLTDSLDPDLIKQWEMLCVEWETDGFPRRKKNPYHLENAYISEAQVKKEMADEEESRLAAGGVSLHATSAGTFVQLGLDLEDTQRRIRRLLVPIYLPGLLQYRTDLARKATSSQNVPKSEYPEDADLWLPSCLPADVRDSICLGNLSKIEERLRDAQCMDSLHKVRQVLKVKTRMIDFKNKNIRGQRDGTRSRTVIDKIHMKARNAADKYRAARRAKMALAGPGEWEERFRVLEDRDIRGYQDPNRLRLRVGRKGVWDDEQLARAGKDNGAANGFLLYNENRTKRDGTGETRRTLSWIWLTSPSTGDNDDKNEILRVEWAKSRARSMRAEEEVMLLKEEMRRVLEFLRWKADWWMARKASRTGLTKELAEGVEGFALTQKNLQTDLANHFRALWKAPLSEDSTNPNSGAENDGDDDEDDDDDDNEDDDERMVDVEDDEGADGQ